MRIARALLFVGTTLIVPTLAFGQIQLTELMPNPDGSDSDREWVEAINPNSALTVTTGRSGWRLSDGDNHLLKGETFTWQLNEVVLFVQDSTKFRAEHASVGNRLIESSFSLKNSGGTVKFTNEQGTILTTASYGESEEGYSLISAGGSWVRGQKNGAPGIYPDTASPVSSPEKKISSPPATPANQSSPSANTAQPTQPQSVIKSTLSPATPSAQPTLPAEAFPSRAGPPPAEAKAGAIAPTQPVETAPSILISEFLPNTDGRDEGEFIELTNTSGGEIKLDDVVVQVGEKKIKLSGTVNGSFIVLPKKDYHFNIKNKGEVITLFWKDKPIHKISYSGAAPAGRSFARLASGDWVWTKPTPGAANVLVEAAKVTDSSSPKVSSRNKNITEEFPLTAEVKKSENTNSLPPTILPTNTTPLLVGFASALLLSLAAVIFLR